MNDRHNTVQGVHKGWLQLCNPIAGMCIDIQLETVAHVIHQLTKFFLLFNTFRDVHLLWHVRHVISIPTLSIPDVASSTVAMALVILVFKSSILWTGVWYTRSLTYCTTTKKKSRGVMSGDRGGQAIGPPLPFAPECPIRFRETMHHIELFPVRTPF